ncbi:zinc metalloproteinase nas-15-like isoform X2 [Liolophura sinensis]|uniref:zinc metalloproteinase nas-15-like isoform X2 n=1 Tax=Liolophura sinensis TaxID=3198878 RepID=UPI003158B676
MAALAVALLGFLVLVKSAPVQQKDEFDPAFPEEVPGMWEGDINEPLMFNPKHRNAIRNRAYRWPNGIVPYHISSAYSSHDRATFLSALQSIEESTKVNGHTCIHFVPRTNQHDYIDIRRETGCHSPVGRHGGHQVISLGHGCERKGTAEHEVLHSLGFWHEQSRYDRDNYVIVHWDNVQHGREHDFNKHSSSDMDLLGQPYDYGSVMHYGAYAFAKDRSKPTLTPKKSGVTIGQRVGLSREDIKKIQLLYGCH